MFVLYKWFENSYYNYHRNYKKLYPQIYHNNKIPIINNLIYKIV